MADKETKWLLDKVVLILLVIFIMAFGVAIEIYSRRRFPENMNVLIRTFFVYLVVSTLLVMKSSTISQRLTNIKNCLIVISVVVLPVILGSVIALFVDKLPMNTLVYTATGTIVALGVVGLLEYLFRENKSTR